MSENNTWFSLVSAVKRGKRKVFQLRYCLQEALSSYSVKQEGKHHDRCFSPRITRCCRKNKYARWTESGYTGAGEKNTIVADT